MISIRCPLNFLGYGQVGINIFNSLIKDHGQEVCFWQMGQIECLPHFHEAIKQAVDNQQRFNNNPHLTIWHEHSLFERIGKGKNCAMSFFELDTFPQRTKISIGCQDSFLVASEWAANIVKKELPNQPVSVIKIGVDTDFYRGFNLNMPDKPYRFLTVGKTEIRKGHDILHELFNKAFTPEDDVELYIAWDNPFLAPADKQKWISLYKDTPLGDKIHFVPRQLDIRTEYAAADCMIFPTRAEAICLPALECMASNKPLIITNYSGQTEFCTPDNSFLVDIDELEPAVDGIWFHGDGNWAKIDPKQEMQFVEYMRHCYKNRINSNPEGRKTAEQLTWKNTTQQIIEVLK